MSGKIMMRSLIAAAVSVLALQAAPTLAQPAKAQSAKVVADNSADGFFLNPNHQGWVDFKKPIQKDPARQHDKEIFIVNGCAYCHGSDLNTRGEAADLLHSPVVGTDTDGSTIAGVLRRGIPLTPKLSPMPKFADLSDTELASIARWIHFARMEGRFNLLMKADTTGGDAAAGAAFYAQTCQSCHTAADIAGKMKAKPAADQKGWVLKPAFLEETVSYRLARLQDAKREDAKAKHSHWLENSNPKDAANLIAYLKSVN